jgi:hypothetical protein
MENEFEYTDEYYYSNGDGGVAIKSFDARERAEVERKRLERKRLTTIDSYVLAEYFRGHTQENWDEAERMAQGNKNARILYAQQIGFSFYHVVEVKLSHARPNKVKDPNVKPKSG